ncbi:MAG: type II secretion system protein [Patescibacteria group bacterium]|jgi:prepilin-type N-terminal cleavage/methylation domain-containing protein
MKLRSGFTFMEIIITIALVGVLMVAVANFASSSFHVWRLIRVQAETYEQTRRSLRTIVKEIREAQTADNGAYAIAGAQAESITFYANIDDDTSQERIRYYYENNQIMLGVVNPVGSPATYPDANEVVTSIAKDVYPDGDIFTYYDESYTGVEAALTDPITPTRVHLIRIHFLIDSDPNTVPDAVDVTTEVTPRNLKEYAPTT